MPTSDDAAAFCAAQYPRLLGALSLYVGDRFVAEELAQEALLRVCQRWEKVARLQSPEGWTWHVARNLANSHFRRARAERRAKQRLARVRAPSSDVRDDHEVVRRAVAVLPVRQKTVLVLRYYLDLTVDDTAVRMGVSADAVRSLSKRAVAELRRQLGPVGALPPANGVRDV